MTKKTKFAAVPAARAILLLSALAAEHKSRRRILLSFWLAESATEPTPSQNKVEEKTPCRRFRGATARPRQ